PRTAAGTTGGPRLRRAAVPWRPRTALRSGRAAARSRPARRAGPAGAAGLTEPRSNPQLGATSDRRRESDPSQAVIPANGRKTKQNGHPRERRWPDVAGVDAAEGNQRPTGSETP